MSQRAFASEPSHDEFDSDEFFANDFLATEVEDEEIGADLDRSGAEYLSGSEKLKRRALGWLVGRTRH